MGIIYKAVNGGTGPGENLQPPKLPDVPKAPPPPQKRKKSETLSLEEQRKRSRDNGLRATVATSPLGLPSTPTLFRTNLRQAKTLLGE